MQIKNKKAGEKYLSIWWFFCLAFIGAGIVAGVLIFGLKEISVKKVEADILVNRVVDCLVKAGNLGKDFLKEDFNLWQKCYLSEEVIDKSGIYYLEVGLFKFEDCSKKDNYDLECKNPVKYREYGDFSLKKNCLVGEKVIKARDFPECVEKNVFVLNENNEEMIMIVSAGSKQQGVKGGIEDVE